MHNILDENFQITIFDLNRYATCLRHFERLDVKYTNSNVFSIIYNIYGHFGVEWALYVKLFGEIYRP